MPMGESVIIDDLNYYIHHINDQEGWEKNPQFHPKFPPGIKPNEEKRVCKFKHEYNSCKCHLELREYGQNESVYHSEDNPSSRWNVDGRFYSISRSKGVSRMVSAFKDYTQQGKYTYLFYKSINTLSLIVFTYYFH